MILSRRNPGLKSKQPSQCQRSSLLEMRRTLLNPLPHIFLYAFPLVLVFASAGCRREATLPVKSSPEYSQAVSAFYVGLAALQVGDDVRADSKLAQLTQLVPDEPAGWANWGLLALRQRNFDAAAERLERARSLAAKQ